MAKERPVIVTTYKADGSYVRQPTGFGGGLCHKATDPYAVRQGGVSEKTETDEARRPPYLEVETASEHERQRE